MIINGEKYEMYTCLNIYIIIHMVICHFMHMKSPKIWMPQFKLFAEL